MSRSTAMVWGSVPTSVGTRKPVITKLVGAWNQKPRVRPLLENVLWYAGNARFWVLLMQAPLEQTCPVEHCLPQLPQWLTSVLRLRHVPEQLVCPEGQAQLPLLQMNPVPHFRPQPPQLLTSVLMFTQALLQVACPLEQTARQDPARQT